MQSPLNLKIKYRESFRPFAPAMLREDLSEWFELRVESPLHAAGRRRCAAPAPVDDGRATAALQHVHDAADDATIIHPLNAPDIRRQKRFDPLPLLIAQPKQVLSHPKTNQDRIVRAEKLMSSEPS
jgi:Carbamoyltransferase C-terminus